MAQVTSRSAAAAAALRRFSIWGVAGVLVLLYALLLHWFDGHDFYHRYFFEHGSRVRHYEWARLAFIFCFAWQVYAAGAMVLSIVLSGRNFGKLLAFERYPLGFLIGIAAWSVLLYIVGLAGQYSRPLAVDVSFAVVLASLPHLAACIDESAKALGRAVKGKRISDLMPDPLSSPGRAASILLRALLAIAIVIAAATFLLVKGLYPGGGHDYYNHYFPFYLRVVQSGSTLPNDVWYHFYQSKGDGLYFLAMLLTDPLAPQLVTAGFILCAAGIVYALLRRVAPAGPLPWIGVLLYFAFFIYTPGPHEFMVQGGWGDLEKEHELTAVPLLGMIWSLYRLFGDFDGDKRPWLLGLHASIVATIIVTLQLGLLIGLYLVGAMVWFAAKRQWREAAVAFFAAVTATTLMAVILAINYVLSGLVLDQAMLFTWPITNVAKLAHWGPLFEALTIDKAMGEYSTNAVPWPPTIRWLLPCYLRLEIWWPLVAVAAIFSLYRLVQSRKSKTPIVTSIGPASAALLWFAAAVALAAAFGGGRSQSVTFYRLTSFSYAPTLCLGLVLWHFGVAEGRDAAHLTRKAAATGLLVLLLAVTLVRAASAGRVGELRGNLHSIVHNAGAFWRGRFSIADAYQNEQGWSGRMPWGGFYPGVEATWRMLPPHTRVWSFHIWSYCMLPDCNFQGYLSFIFSPQWRTVYFDTPERARTTLHAQGLDYFFFSKEMRIEDTLGHAPLFSPDNIGRYLAVRWSDGTSYLLTWPGPDTRPIDENFLSAYRALTEQSATYQNFDVEAWKTIADEIAGQEAKGEKLHPFPLPWCPRCDVLFR